MQYDYDAEPEEGYYEISLGFFWNDDREEGPQTVTVDFQLTAEMEEDYPGREAEEEHGFANAERQREDWVQHHLYDLLHNGFVIDAYSYDNEYIDSVADLKDELENMNFNEHYV